MSEATGHPVRELLAMDREAYRVLAQMTAERARRREREHQRHRRRNGAP